MATTRVNQSIIIKPLLQHTENDIFGVLFSYIEGIRMYDEEQIRKTFELLGIAITDAVKTFAELFKELNKTINNIPTYSYKANQRKKHIKQQRTNRIEYERKLQHQIKTQQDRATKVHIHRHRNRREIRI